MLVAQADPGWDQSDPTRAPTRNPQTLAETDGQPDGFQTYLSALRDAVVAFRKPVAYPPRELLQLSQHRLHLLILRCSGRRKIPLIEISIDRESIRLEAPAARKLQLRS